VRSLRMTTRCEQDSKQDGTPEVKPDDCVSMTQF
jgi:hypothetical protein